MNNFIFVIPAFFVLAPNLNNYYKKYLFLTDWLDIFRQETKNCTDKIIFLFYIKIDTNFFMAQIPADKLQIAKNVTGETISNKTLILNEV